MLKAEVDEEGFLWIKRTGGFREAYCPFDPGDQECHCGEWCPHFGEPVIVHFDVSEPEIQVFTSLRICQKQEFEVVADLRKDEATDQCPSPSADTP